MNSKKFLTRGQELGIMSSSRVRIVTKHSTHLEKKKRTRKKFLTMGSSSSIMSPSRTGYVNLLISHNEFTSWMN